MTKHTNPGDDPFARHQPLNLSYYDWTPREQLRAQELHGQRVLVLGRATAGGTTGTDDDPDQPGDPIVADGVFCVPELQAHQVRAARADDDGEDSAGADRALAAILGALNTPAGRAARAARRHERKKLHD